MKGKLKLLFGSGGALLVSLSLTGPVFAATLLPPSGYESLGRITLDTALRAIIQILLFLAFTVAFIFLIIGGIRWIMSGGDKAAAESARGTLTAAIIGLIVVLLTWAILTIIGELFGINIVGGNLSLPSLIGA